MASGTKSNEEYSEDVWKLLSTYFSHNQELQLVKHLLDSYNDFVLKRIDQILEGFNPIEVFHGYDAQLNGHRYEISIEITNPVLTKPTVHEKDGRTKLMTPNDARTRGLTYAGTLLVDVSFTAKTRVGSTMQIERKSFSGVSLGKLPIMVRSRYCMLGSNNNNNNDIMTLNECRFDVGGYFVVNGNEKVVISHDRMAENKTYVFLNTKVSPYSHIADIRSMSDSRYGMPKTTALKYSLKPNQVLGLRPISPPWLRPGRTRLWLPLFYIPAISPPYPRHGSALLTTFSLFPQLGRFIRVTVQHVKVGNTFFFKKNNTISQAQAWSGGLEG